MDNIGEKPIFAVKMKRIVYLVMVIGVLLGCGERREYREMLSRAEEMMNDHPDSALMILDSLGQHEKEFGRHFRMQYKLRFTLAQTKTGTLFKTDSLTKTLVEHFNSSGTKTEKAWAYYLHGCALSDIGKAPEALQAYYDAIEATDTTRTDCDYNTLKVIYGQMFQIYHKQNLPHDEIWAMRHYIDCVRRTSSEEDYIISRSQMIRPYFLLGNKDTVLTILDETYQSLLSLGKERRAASALAPSIYIYTERHQLDKAKQIMDIFEQKSGLFDNEGNIVKGREGYYWEKGFYEYAVKNLDSAEYYFRKAIKYGYLSEGYRGLLSIYREKHNIDSVVRFSQLYEAAQDSLHNQMRTDAVHQASELYNYNKSQKELEKERANVREARTSAAFIILFALIFIGGTIGYYLWNQKKRKAKIDKYKSELNKAITTRNELRAELKQLKDKDYEGIIALKESKVTELTDAIGRLEAENEGYKLKDIAKETDHFEDFLDSKIAQLFVKKATGRTERPQVTEAEWIMLENEFSKDNPVTYKSFGKGRPLSQLEQRICILLVLDIPENVISNMAGTSTSTISNLKARANEKLFGRKEAQPLKNNLKHALQRSW